MFTNWSHTRSLVSPKPYLTFAFRLSSISPACLEDRQMQVELGVSLASQSPDVSSVIDQYASAMQDVCKYMAHAEGGVAVLCCIVLGGADTCVLGVGGRFVARVHDVSRPFVLILTLHHALVRVFLLLSLCRVWAITLSFPYHSTSSLPFLPSSPIAELYQASGVNRWVESPLRYNFFIHLVACLYPGTSQHSDRSHIDRDIHQARLNMNK